MLKQEPRALRGSRLNWLSKPNPGHCVQFYKSEADLMNPLAKFIGSGLEAGDSCITIATAEHTDKLTQLLELRGINPDKYYRSGQLITLDAAETLAKFMVKGMPNAELFRIQVGSLIAGATANSRPIRAYGEMVALLWQEGNRRAVLQLEYLWNELARDFDFSLYCAYPELHFILDGCTKDDISDCHNLTFQPQTV